MTYRELGLRIDQMTDEQLSSTVTVLDTVYDGECEAEFNIINGKPLLIIGE